MTFSPFKSLSSQNDELPRVTRGAAMYLPNLRVRLSDSNAAPADADKPMVTRAIELIDEYAREVDPARKLALLAHMFFTTEASLAALDPVGPRPGVVAPIQRVRSNAVRIGPVVIERLRRRVALRELYAAVAGQLTERFNTTVNVLPRFLEDRFGTEISEHGVRVDLPMLSGADDGFGGKRSPPAYLGQYDRRKYRVILRQGRAFALKTDGGVAREVPLDTTQDNFNTYRNKHRFYAWGFVLSMARELYVANHAMAEKSEGGNFFHSSYLSGDNVLSAGDCIFKDGHLQSITNLSGHYQPTPASLVHVLELFKTHGFNIANVLVGAVDEPEQDILRRWSIDEEFKEEALSAPAFLTDQKNFSSLTDGGGRRGDLSKLRRAAHVHHERVLPPTARKPQGL